MHHDGIAAGAVVGAAAANGLIPQLRIQRESRLVSVLNLKRRRRAAEHLRIVAHVSKQLAGDTGTTMGCGDRDIENLHIAIDHHASGETDKLAIVVGDPPRPRCGDVRIELG